MSIRSITATDALAHAKANPNNVFVVAPKKSFGKAKSATYFDLYYPVNGKKENWFAIENIPISRDAADPANADDSRNEHVKEPGGYSSMRSCIQVSITDAGEFGELAMLAQNQWRPYVEENKDEWGIDVKIHDLVTIERVEGVGKAKVVIPLEDPNIKLKIQWGNFSDKHPNAFLRSQPQVRFEDYDTMKVVGKGDSAEAVMEPFKVYNPVTKRNEFVNEGNFHLMVTRGAIIKFAQIEHSSAVISASWFSAPFYVRYAVIQRAPRGGFITKMAIPKDMLAQANKIAAAVEVNPADQDQFDPTHAPMEVAEPDPVEDPMVIGDDLATALDGIIMDV